jgi:hypothetical protein
MKAIIELLDGSTTIRYLNAEWPPATLRIEPVTYHHQGTFFPEGTPIYRAAKVARSQQHKAEHKADHKPADE